MSFLSPCVAPLVPIYMSYLAYDSKLQDENGNIVYNTKKVFITTLFFVMGIMSTFLVLSLSSGLFSAYIEKYREVAMIVGGTLIIIFGIIETGVIKVDLFERDYHFSFDQSKPMSAFRGYLMGLLFSLGWTPCIGPLMASVIIMAAAGESGILYLLIYGGGLCVPFLLCGLFTAKLLDLFKKYRRVVRYSMILAGVIMMFFGASMIKDGAVAIDGYKELEKTTDNICVVMDLNGNTIDLSVPTGKYVYLNFITTWCTYCNREIGEYQQFAQRHDVICYYVMSELANNNVSSNEEYVKDNDIVLPVINDVTGSLHYYLSVKSYPTIYVIGPDGSMLGYHSGYLNEESFIELHKSVVDMYNEKLEQK